MNSKIYILAGILLLVGMSYSLGNVTTITNWTGTGTTWSAGGVDHTTVDGGYIYGKNLSANSQTDKWADIYGNVSATIYLKYNNTVAAYTWTWNASKGGIVCFGTYGSGSSAVLNNVTGADGAAIDSVWGFATDDTDSGTNTYNVSMPSGYLNFNANTNPNGVTNSNTKCADLNANNGNSSFDSCAVNWTTASSGTNQLGICTIINGSGTNYNGDNVNYEVLLPANETDAQLTTYYAYAELH